MTVTPFPEDQADFSPFPEDQEGYFDAQAEAIAADQSDQPDAQQIAEDRHYDAQAEAMAAQAETSGEKPPSTDLF